MRRFAENTANIPIYNYVNTSKTVETRQDGEMEFNANLTQFLRPRNKKS